MAQVQFREPKTAAEVFANAKATHDYFKRLRSPPPKFAIAAPPPIASVSVIARKPIHIVPIEALAVCLSPGFAIVADHQIERPSGTEPLIESIIRAVCLHYGVKKLGILSSCRTAAMVRPRQVICYLAKKLTLKSYPEIGRRIGGKDHTTVLHAVRKIERLRGSDLVLAALLDAFETRLRPRAQEAA